jgi:hypothetical protein
VGIGREKEDGGGSASETKYDTEEANEEGDQ